MVASGRLIAVGAAVVIVAGGAVAVARATTNHKPQVAAAPALTGAERRELNAAGPLVAALPAAIKELPVAASDLSHGKISTGTAGSRIAHSPALQALTGSGPTITLITAAYRGAVSRGSIPEVDRLAAAVNQLSAIEGDLLPAVRVAATTGSNPVAAASALSAIEADPQSRDLAVVLSDWPQLYGALTLVEQAAPQS